MNAATRKALMASSMDTDFWRLTPEAAVSPWEEQHTGFVLRHDAPGQVITFRHAGCCEFSACTACQKQYGHCTNCTWRVEQEQLLVTVL